MISAPDRRETLQLIEDAVAMVLTLCDPDLLLNQ